MTKLIIITGFLGAGKTSVLNNLIESLPHSEKAYVMINELSPVRIDANLVNHTGVKIKEIRDGCICCTKNKAFQKTLRTIERHKQDYILVETTGLGNIKPIICAASLSGIKISGVLTVLDVHRFAKSNRFGHSARKQIEYSSSIIINKVDLINEGIINLIEQEIKKINQTARIFKTKNGNIKFGEIEYQEPNEIWKKAKRQKQVINHIRLNGIRNVCYETQSALDYKKFREFVSEFGRNIYKAKGLINFAGEKLTYFFDYSDRILSLEPHEHYYSNSKIVIVGKLSIFQKADIFLRVRQLRTSEGRHRKREKIKNIKRFLNGI